MLQAAGNLTATYPHCRPGQCRGLSVLQAPAANFHRTHAALPTRDTWAPNGNKIAQLWDGVATHDRSYDCLSCISAQLRLSLLVYDIKLSPVRCTAHRNKRSCGAALAVPDATRPVLNPITGACELVSQGQRAHLQQGLAFVDSVHKIQLVQLQVRNRVQRRRVAEPVPGAQSLSQEVQPRLMRSHRCIGGSERRVDTGWICIYLLNQGT